MPHSPEPARTNVTAQPLARCPSTTRLDTGALACFCCADANDPINRTMKAPNCTCLIMMMRPPILLLLHPACQVFAIPFADLSPQSSLAAGPLLVKSGRRAPPDPVPRVSALDLRLVSHPVRYRVDLCDPGRDG